MRTRNSFLNMITNLLPSLILPVLSLFKLSWLLKTYGADVYGMNMYLTQVMGYLNLIEGGFGFAFVQALFKPLAENDRKKVCELYNGAKVILKAIGSIILALGIVVLIILPMLLKSSLNFIFIRTVFLLMIIPTIVDYFLMAPSFIMQADQKEYILNIIRKSIQIIRVLTHIFIICNSLHYYYIVATEAFYVIFQSYLSRYVVFKYYPWLKNKDQKDFSTLNNAKFLFAHRLAGVVLNSTDTILLGAFIGTYANALYGNYIYIVSEVQKIVESVINAPKASIGNLFAKENERSYDIFKEYFYFTSFIASIICISLFLTINSFVNYWQNAAVVLTHLDAFFFSGILYFIIVRLPIMNVRDTNGLFKQSKKYAYMEAALNFSFSIIGIYFWGITGALFVTFMTYLLSDLLMNSRLVFKVIFKIGIINYYKMYVGNLLINLFVGIGAWFFWQKILLKNISGLISWFLFSGILFILVLIVIFLIYNIMFRDFKFFIGRILNLLQRKKAIES